MDGYLIALQQKRQMLEAEIAGIDKTIEHIRSHCKHEEVAKRDPAELCWPSVASSLAFVCLFCGAHVSKGKE